MNNQTWMYYLPEDSGVYFWQPPNTHQKPMCVFWNADECTAIDFWGFEFHPQDGGRWYAPTHPDPNSPWDRPQPVDHQLEITNSTTEPVQVRISPIDDCILESAWVDKHPKVLDGLNDDTNN